MSIINIGRSQSQHWSAYLGSPSGALLSGHGK
jgi:hypothetical protein